VKKRGAFLTNERTTICRRRDQSEKSLPVVLLSGVRGQKGRLAKQGTESSGGVPDCLRRGGEGVKEIEAKKRGGFGNEDVPFGDDVKTHAKRQLRMVEDFPNCKGRGGSGPRSRTTTLSEGL